MITSHALFRRGWCALLLPVLLAAPVASAGTVPTDDEYRAAFLARCVEAREAMAHKQWPEGYDSRVRIYLGIVKLATGIDAATGLKYLEDAVADPQPFWGCFETYAPSGLPSVGPAKEGGRALPGGACGVSGIRSANGAPLSQPRATP